MRFTLIAPLFGLLAVWPVSAQVGPALQLVGPSGAARSLTDADLAALPALELTVLEEGTTATYRGPSLRELATFVGAPTGRGPLRVVVPEDEFHARWARQVVRVRIVQVAPSPR